MLHPASSAKLPIPYGGEFETEITVGAGGLLTSAPTVVRFAAHHAAFGTGERAPNSARSGGFAGTASWVESRTDGRDWSYLLDTDIFPAKKPWDLNTLPKTINAYLDKHK